MDIIVTIQTPYSSYKYIYEPTIKKFLLTPNEILRLEIQYGIDETKDGII